MAQRPIGKIDHIGIAVKSIAEARKFFEGALGATFLYEHANPEGGYTIVELDLNGFVLELLEPLGDDSFLHGFLARRGEGVHHLTLDVPDAKEKIAELKNAGIGTCRSCWKRSRCSCSYGLRTRRTSPRTPSARRE